MIILRFIGEEGGAVKGVCTFTLSLAFLFINGVQGAMRPLAGLLSGAKEWEGLRILMQQCFVLILSLVGIYSLSVILFPGLFYYVHGVRTVPDGGLRALRLYALHFVFKGCDAIFRAYFVHRHENHFSTLLMIVGYAALPAFAFLIGNAGKGEWLWIAYLLSEMLIFTCNLLRYRRWSALDKKEKKENSGLIYLSVLPGEAAEASQLVKSYAEANGVDREKAYRVSLCLEKMVVYAEKSQKNDSLQVQIMIRFHPDEAILMVLDNGRCIALDQDANLQKLTNGNYDLIRKVAREV